MFWTHLAFIAVLQAPSAVSHDALMQRIERQIILPQGAGPLSRYGRNYASSGDDEVIGVFVIPPQRYTEKTSCFFGGHPCTPEYMKGMIKRRNDYIDAQAALGTYRWHGSPEGLPAIMDGGCSVITLHYKVSSDQVLTIRCNGVA